jgi:hypothetical protein
MNDETRRDSEDAADPGERGGGPNLALIYGLIGLAMLIAIAVAAMVVLPFYHRR